MILLTDSPAHAIRWWHTVEAGGVEPQWETLQIVPWHRPTAPISAALIAQGD